MDHAKQVWWKTINPKDQPGRRVTWKKKKTGFGGLPWHSWFCWPLVWLRFELDPELEKTYSLRLQLWPAGEDHLLALGDPHGSFVKWL